MSQKPHQDDFKKNRNPRRGKLHPESMTNPFWTWCVETKNSGYENNEAFDGPSSFEAGPCWSFDRFGQSETPLPDGRTVFIAGEHEDSYDPDFYIYNDVTIVSRDGETTILGYPEDVFPPTDFHTATLVDDEIILIGSLGYPEKRIEGATQVLRLNLHDWTMSHQDTTHAPGWISEHTAELSSDRQKIRISNLHRWTESCDLFDDFSTWELDLKTWKWQCIEKKNWRQFRITRIDQEGNNLWTIRNAIEMKSLGLDHNQFLNDQDPEVTKAFQEMKTEEEDLLQSTDTRLLPGLYHPSVDHEAIPQPEYDLDADEEDFLYNHHRIRVDGVEICFIEDSYDIIARIEGELPSSKIDQIISDVCQNLGQFENAPYQSMEIL